MPDIALYLQRISFLLRQGEPANDVALYLPTDDAWAGFTLGHDSINQAMDGLLGDKVIPQILDAGYNFDFIDDGAIAHAGVPYRVLILPGVERIPAATLPKLEEFVKKGGILIATRRVPAQAPAKLVADETKLGAELHALLTPDVATAPQIGFVHRKLPFAEIYFLANTSNLPVRRKSEFRVKGLHPAWWDPFTGKVVSAGDGSTVELNLAPYESRVLVFSKEILMDPREMRTLPVFSDLSVGWKVTFEGSTQPSAMDFLRSWTDLEDRKYFSGRATYERTMTLSQPESFQGSQMTLNFGNGKPVTTEERRSGNGMRAMLEGPVREAALVYVNGKLAGSVWRPPYEVDVTELLHAGQNTLRVVVANLEINELAKGPLPDYKALNAKYGERFQPQDMANLQPLPSGLLGPIRLIVK
jgi:hypothetical protein